MAYLRVEKKKSGTYLRIVETFRKDGKVKQRTLHSLGKVEDYPTNQLKGIASKLLELAGVKMEDIVGKSFKEVNRLNYGYALVIKKLWKMFDMDKLSRIISLRTKTKFDWVNIVQLMIAERINDPVSKRQNYFHAKEYIGFNSEVNLQYFYRTLDILSDNVEELKEHFFKAQQNLFTQQLDVVFYDVTTLYFDSQKEEESSIRQKGYSKDGKATKTQVVLGLLVDKLRNPITYQIYKGNTYEGHTMVDALNALSKKYNIDQCVVVADSAMIDKENRERLNEKGITYIIGDRLKGLPKDIKEGLVNREAHQPISPDISPSIFSYTEISYQDRRIICTYSEKRARKDAHNREKLLKKAAQWIANPSKYTQIKKKGAGRYIKTDTEGSPKELNEEQIKADAKYDGFKAIATTTKLDASEILEKYKDLFEVEHSFRALKSQLRIRPMYHWTNKRIEGHVAMSFIAYTMLNYMRNLTKLQYKEIVRALDKMQMSQIKEDESEEYVYMRASIDDTQKVINDKLKLVVPNDITPHSTINQLFM